MDNQTFINLIQTIVSQATTLKDKYLEIGQTPVNYACIFAHNLNEYNVFNTIAQQLGKVVKDTPTGIIFQFPPINTATGELKLVKVRRPDPTRTELGDADFTVPNFPEFERDVLTKKGFSLIQRENMKMIELIDPAFDVRAYFSHPTLLVLLGIK